MPVSAIISVLSQFKPKTVWVGFSGGLDSAVLLHAVSSLCHPGAVQQNSGSLSINVQAIHVHHGLSPLADQWAQHCLNEAAKLNISCHIERLADKPKSGESIEHWAREGRYACFAKYIKKDDLLLTAHHQDDQAETVLLQLMRGAGPKGLSAMPAFNTFSEGIHTRPFLTISRQELEAYAKQHGLVFVEDHSNQDTRFDRNFIRHQVMPVLKQRWPSCNELISRAAQNCAEQEQVLQEYIEAETLICPQTKTQSLAIDALLHFSSAKQNLLLRTWAHKISQKTPGRQLLESIRRNLLSAAKDAEPYLKWGDWEFHRYQAQLYLIQALPEVPQNYSVRWDGNKPLQVPTWPELLSKEYLANQGLEVDKLDWTQVTVKLRQGGERCHPKGRQHSQTLKKCLQEYYVLPWLRDRMPLIYCADKLVMAVGAFVCIIK
jgi:tRNA(Ile)-lysidine synthase